MDDNGGIGLELKGDHFYKLAGLDGRRRTSIFSLDGVSFGGGELVVIAGPCSVESRTQMVEAAEAVKKAGAHLLRGGAFKPRSSPYSFQGLGKAGLKILAEARAVTGLPIVTEVVDAADVDMVETYADVLQVGSRNSQNFSLLKRLGQSRKPVMLKRGLMSTVDELLGSAEYILAGGNERVVLCERGIRTFEPSTRNTLDLTAVPVIKERSHLPVVVDPSHASGLARYVPALAKAALAVGADGLMIEVHGRPEEALCDGDESLNPVEFLRLMAELRALAPHFGRVISTNGSILEGGTND